MKMVRLRILVKSMETKNSIRKHILALRNEMKIEECMKKSICIRQNVLSIPAVRNANCVLCYASYKSEVMTEEIIDDLLQMGKQVYLPKVSGDDMDFYLIKDPAELSEGYKGILEPSRNHTDIFTKDMWIQNMERTVMLMPGAAFSETGARIGYGKGYYDRYLKRIPCAERIALCYEMQIVEDIPADDHDIPVSAIVTEEKIRHIIKAKMYRHYYI